MEAPLQEVSVPVMSVASVQQEVSGLVSVEVLELVSEALER